MEEKLQCCIAQEPSWIFTLKNKMIIFISELKYFFHLKKRPDCSLVSHAKREFLAAGYNVPTKDQPEDPNKWIQENVLELLQVFSKQGHSGFSAGYCINYFSTLAKYSLLTPLHGTEDEWNNLEYTRDTNELYQNNRLGSVFKEGESGIPYYMDAIVFKDQNKSCFTGSVEDISSAQNIRLPFLPKTFYVDVISTEVNKETNEPEPGSGWWDSVIKDRSQLDKVWEYYDKRILV